MKPKFKSFLMAGFECTYAKAEGGKRFDLLAASKHDELVTKDYELVSQLGIKTVREGFSWSGIDKGNGVYDFARFNPILQAGKDADIQQIWDLNHFDFPDDTNPFGSNFPKRYAEYSKRVIEQIRKYEKGTVYIVPLNEPSFFAWMCDVGLWAPYKKGKGTQFKKQLVKAALAAMDAIWEEDKDVQFIQVDPFMYRQPLRVSSKEDNEFCDNFNNHVRFHSWDMISGRTNPELGGDPKYLCMVGINYYFYNQQLVGVKDKKKNDFTFRSMALNHPKRVPLTNVLQQVYGRYQKPIVIMETGSYRDRRPQWWKYILGEVDNALKQKMPLYGVCSYPTLDIIKGSGFIVPKSGLWDFDQRAKDYKRIPHKETLSIIKNWTKK